MKSKSNSSVYYLIPVIFSVTMAFLAGPFYGCAGGGSAVKTKQPPQESAATVVKNAYEYITTGDEGIILTNTRNGEVKVIFQCTPEPQSVYYRISPGKTRMAFAFYDTEKKETNLIIYNFSDGTTYWAKRNKNRYGVGAFWEGDSIIYTNFVELKSGSKSKGFIPGKAYTECIDVAHDKVLKSFIPKAGHTLETYVQGKYLVYSDANGFYLIDRTGNKVVKTIRDFTENNRKSVTYSPDGGKLLYIESKTLPGKVQKNQLLLAEYDGTGDKIILSADYDPRDVSWSPDGNKIVCSIASSTYPGIRHIAFFETDTRKTSFSAEESYGVVPSFSNMMFSPSGNFVFMKVQKDTAAYYAVRNIATGRDYHVRDTAGDYKTDFLVGAIGWCDDQNVIFSAADNMQYVYNLTDFSLVPLAESPRPLLYVRQLY